MYNDTDPIIGKCAFGDEWSFGTGDIRGPIVCMTGTRIPAHRPFAVVLIGWFLVISTGILFTASFTLFRPGTVVDLIWRVKEAEHAQLMDHRIVICAGFLALGLLMAATAYGWSRSRKWAWWLAIGIFIANGVGDATRLLQGQWPEGLMGVCITVLLVVYLTRAKVRGLFR